VAQSASRFIGFIYTIFIARSLGVADFGLYTVSLSYFSLISSIADFGLNRFLIRESALKRYKISELICNISLLRLTITCVLFAVFSLILYALDPDKGRVSFALLAVLAVVPLSLAQTLDAAFAGIRKLQYSAISLFALSIFTALFGIFLIKMGFGTTGAIVALILGHVAYYLIQLVLIRRDKISIISKVEFETLKRVLNGSYLYGILGVIGLVSFKIDTIILSYFRGNFETGIYGASFKFLESISFIPTIFSTALFPILTKLHEQSSQQLRIIYIKSIKIMLVLGGLSALGFAFVLPAVINIFLPKFLASIPVLRILAISIPFIFLHIPSAQVILSTDKYLKQALFIFSFLLIMNISLYLIFIPPFGYFGAAWVSVFSEISTFVAFYIFLRLKVLR